MFLYNPAAFANVLLPLGRIKLNVCRKTSSRDKMYLTLIMLIGGVNCTQFQLQKSDAMAKLATWHTAKAWAFSSVLVVIKASLNLPICEVNKGGQVNPLGSESRSAFLSRHTAESDTERLGVLVCVMWLLTVM